MTKHSSSTVIKTISNLLTLLKSNSNRSGIKIDGLEALESNLKNNSDDLNSWALNSDLTFKKINISMLKVPKVVANEIIDCFLKLRVHITEKSSSKDKIEDSILQSSTRPYIIYSVQIILYGKTKEGISDYKMSWHLDKHIRSQNEGDGIGKGFIHPEYHFNMGGYTLTKNENISFGDILLLDTPRLMHPPLDIVLAIDFVLNNFYGICTQNLVCSQPYKRIIKETKERLWRPYFIALANQWDPLRFNDLEIQADYANKITGHN